jgi:hypothetical protein
MEEAARAAREAVGAPGEEAGAREAEEGAEVLAAAGEAGEVGPMGRGAVGQAAWGDGVLCLAATRLAGRAARAQSLHICMQGLRNLSMHACWQCAGQAGAIRRTHLERPATRAPRLRPTVRKCSATTCPISSSWSCLLLLHLLSLRAAASSADSSAPWGHLSQGHAA